jgi:hypothetical protein
MPVQTGIQVTPGWIDLNLDSRLRGNDEQLKVERKTTTAEPTPL